MKKALTVILSLILTMLCLSANVYADVWIPPEDCNEYLVYLPGMEGCDALNIFVSNYIEAGVFEYSDTDPSSLIIKSMLKHFELNADAYKDYVTILAGNDGKYMKIDADIFEERTLELYNITIDPSSVDGYNNGYIYASADYADTTIKYMAGVKYCEYEYGNRYELEFYIYYCESGVADLYDKPYNELNELDNIDVIGEGSCEFLYYGDITNTKFKPSDFTIAEIDADGFDAAYLSPCESCDEHGNRGYTSQIYPDTLITTESPDDSTAPVDAQTEDYDETIEIVDIYENTEKDNANIKEHSNIRDNGKNSGNDTNALLLIITISMVILVIILALVIILLYTKKNKNNTTKG